MAKKKKDEFQAFYTNCNYITGYMVELLECDSEMSVLEPCAGDGAFIDELINKKCNVYITAFEINSESVSNLNKKYYNLNNVKIIDGDFAFIESTEKYDRVIANPPYGAYQTPERRAQLKIAYPDIYAKETYGIFLVRSMEMLKKNGRLVFIVPDTFLTLHMHEGLRRKLLLEYTIESIVLFPSKFFPGVNFGYAGLSIISVKKDKASDKYCFPIYQGLLSPEDLDTLSTQERLQFEVGKFSYESLKKNPSLSFYRSSDSWVKSILESSNQTIESICNVVTGFYSGNDAHYLKRAEFISRGAKKYSVVDISLIYEVNHDQPPYLDGISEQRHWIPIVKGGNKRFFKPSEWFMDWSKEAVHEYKVVNKKRARFQNPQFYFKQGIAVPMVSSSAITAALIDFRLIDQSIVGVFPKDGQQHLLMYLLGFFNSKVCNKLIRTINASTNNSSNYIKKIPIIIPDKIHIDKVIAIVEKLYEYAKQHEIIESDVRELDEAFYEIFGINS